MRRALTVALSLLLGMACTGDPPPADPGPEPEREPAPPVDDPPVTDTDEGIDCTLVVSPTDPWITPGGEVRFTVTGGSGAPRFAFLDNASGALLDPRQGTYLAGATVDVVDRIAITDPACPDAGVRAQVHVAPPLRIEPSHVTLRPGTVVVPSITGGTEDLSCRLEGADTGSSLDGCTYTAGPRTGSEILWVDDGRTGDSTSASIRIDPAAALSSRVQHWGGVVDEIVSPPVSGGSSHYRIDVGLADVDVTEEGGLRARSAGRHTLRVEDLYAGLDLELTYDALEVLVPDHLQPHGERTDAGRLLGGHDLDGDGYEDLVVLSPEVSLGSAFSGVAWVYAGSPSGLETSPSLALDGSRYGRLGNGGALGDFDGDGTLDLAAGQIYDNVGGGQRGSLSVFDGLPDGFFEDTPSQVLRAGASFDRMGLAVGACDLDGDGYDDVLVSAYQGEDPDEEAAARDQGLVYGFRGGPTGLSERPDWTLVGRVPDGRGRWEARDELRFGIDIVTGDIDDDGHCDVAVSANQGAERGSTYGSVYVYFGSASGPSADADVVVDHDPVGSDPDGRVGRRMAMANLDGQQGADLIVGGDGVDAGGVGRGTVRVFTSATLMAAEDPLTLDDADWRADGGLNWDRMGWGVAAVDVDEDGVDDLIVGAHSDELSGGPRDSGVVYLWDGGDLRADLRRGIPVAGSPEWAFATDESFSRLGTAVTAVDSDGDGTREVVALAPQDSDDVPWGGALHVIDGPGDTSRIGLERSVHFSYLGLGLAWSQDRTGAAALLIGAPYAVSERPRYRGGLAWAAPRADLQDTRSTLPVPPDHGDWDLGGYSLGSGDFDGDGGSEQLVVYRQADRPTSFSSSTFANPGECPGRRANSGAVLVVEPGASEPTAIFYGNANERLDAVVGEADLNGDGYDDLVVSTRQDPSSQGVWVVWGRRLADDGRTTVLCEGTRLVARERASQLGVSLAAVGDLDGDGCDEVAIGANSDDRGRGNQGAVRVLRGWGRSGCPAEPSVTDLVPDVSGALFGSAITSGDVTGDGVQDLLASATNQVGEGGSRGVVYLIDGAAVGRLPAAPVRAETLPTGPTTVLDSSLVLATVPATAELPALGYALGISTTRDPIVWIPSRDAELGGGQGALLGYRWRDRSLVLERILVGPPADHLTGFGGRLAARPGTEDVAISAYLADGVGVEAGEVYVWAP